jgi:two-component system, OmpR family, phosphate regulon sensor histidine kinase PhoR
MEKLLSLEICEAFVVAIPDAALIVSKSGIILAANKAATSLLGYKGSEEHISSLMRSPAILSAVNEVFNSHAPTATQAILRRAVAISLEVHCSAIGRSEKNEALALLICRDLTTVQQIEKMRSDFVANASHELRTPLTTLSGFIETLQSGTKIDAKSQAEFLKIMKSQSDRMARLIDDLLSLSRIETSEHLNPDVMIDLAQVTRGTVALLTPLAEKLDCKIITTLNLPLPILGDEMQLGQVVHNLLENALRYSGKGKTVEVSGEIVADEVCLSVKDNGVGIAPHHIPRLTERFYRVSAEASRQRDGTGLGLAICKHIVNRHRGRLAIKSKLGEGSSFSVLIPLNFIN